MTATATEALRPGAAYFSPGVRIFALGELTAGPEPGTEVAPDVMADVQRLEVTRVANGGSQYSITLNNWYTTTAADRRTNGAGEHSDRGSHVHDWPRFKYNDFSLLRFGQRLRIDLRYWPDAPASGRGASNRWVPMVAGPITDMQFSFGDSGSTVVVSGEDDLSKLKDRVLERQTLGPHPERALVDRVLTLAGYPLNPPAPPLVPWPPFAEDGEAPEESISDGQSYLEFLQRLADRLDLEVFIEFASLDDPSSGVQLHVEPARSARGPDEGDRETYVVERGKTLLSYGPTIKVVDQPSDVRVRGRHRDREIPEPVDQVAIPSAVAEELFPSGLKTGPEVRATYFPDRPNPMVLPNETNLDDGRGLHMANVKLRQKAREFFTIEGSTLGLPRMRPGGYVEIKGMRPPFDGFFYVTKTVHAYGNDGYRTRFSARRPGMPVPPYTEG